MKLLLKIAIVVIVARILVHTPKGTNQVLDSINGFTLHDVAVRVDNLFAYLQETVLGWFA